MSGSGGVERTPLPKTHSLTTLDRPAGDTDPHQCQKRLEEAEASQVMAEAGEESREAVSLPAERGARHYPADGGRVPHVRSGGDRGHVATTAGQEEALSLTAGEGAVSVSVATDSSLRNGSQCGEPGGLGRGPTLEIRGAERSACEVLAEAEAKAEEMKTGKCTVFSVAVGEEVVEKERVKEEKAVEQKMELEEKPVGEEIEMEENKLVEEVEEEAGPHPLNMDLRMNPLEAIQMELDTVNAQADRAFQQLEHKFGRMRRHYLERRNYIIQNIPGFWVTAFRNHPQLSPMIRGQDAEMLRYITNLEVKELRHPRTGCKFKFFFRRNPYFRNKLIVKEYEVRASGRVVSLSTPIMWRPGHEPQSFIRRNQDVVCNFFTWFSDHSLPESDKIAEIIKEDLWPNPLQYYLLREGVRRPRHRPIREPVEIPRPFGFQSG
nr:testis-specific Y-encoded-like protein 1 [Manis javanica]